MRDFKAQERDAQISQGEFGSTREIESSLGAAS